MKRKFINAASIIAGVVISTMSVAAYESRTAAQVKSSAVIMQQAIALEDEITSDYIASVLKDKRAIRREQEDLEIAARDAELQIKAAAARGAQQQSKAPAVSSNTYSTASSQNAGSKAVYSRGGTPPAQKSSVELLDWWKDGRAVFAVNTVAEVTDLYTGRSFKVKRTMGTNHADAEALTKGDTDIIKSIWGGFSWNRRPVILNISGRRLAASMSAMPHAGIDSAPLNAIVSNRSGDFGRGENLDAVKGNGMDGHIDIHFLNSTRHMDSKKDPEHQAAVMKAAGR